MKCIKGISVESGSGMFPYICARDLYGRMVRMELGALAEDR